MRYNLIFFGTGRFACPSIELLAKTHNLLALITSPNPSPVREVAQKVGTKILDPPSPNTPDFIGLLKELAPDMLCLTAYGYILSPEILNIPKLASINLHPSLLPKYRGAAPIQWAILRGEKYTGVTTFLMDPKIDHGNILLQEKIEIQEDETYGEFEERLAEIGAHLLLKTINKLEELKPISQSDTNASYAPKITKEMRLINWNQSATEIVNLIRALSPKPLAYTTFRGRQLEIISASKSELTGEPGKIVRTKGALLVGAADECVELKTLKPEAKREQSALDFINGYHPKPGEMME